VRPISLEGQVAVVTGGGRGIGRAIAQTLGAAGAAVAVLARSEGELAETVATIQRAGGRAEAVVADVTVPDAVHDAMQTVERALGPVDLLVNSAGAIKPFGPLWKIDADEWWRTMEVNVRGPLVCSQRVLPGMVERRRGRIVNITSRAGTVSMPYYTSYMASKTALIRFTECLALETREYGVAVFAISPGTVRTKMTEYSLYSPEGQTWLPWFRQIFDQHIDVPPERPAALVLDLASGRADALSGRTLSIFDDLEVVLNNATRIEEQNLYSLKMDGLAEAGVNPAARVVAAARNAVPSADADRDV
jgi:NAD(P)-dependent dehydrogenase (short-subunit alcohol dehydrogenase family)